MRDAFASCTWCTATIAVVAVVAAVAVALCVLVTRIAGGAVEGRRGLSCPFCWAHDRKITTQDRAICEELATPSNLVPYVRRGSH
jgi:hypothetical protein